MYIVVVSDHINSGIPIADISESVYRGLLGNDGSVRKRCAFNRLLSNFGNESHAVGLSTDSQRSTILHSRCRVGSKGSFRVTAYDDCNLRATALDKLARRIEGRAVRDIELSARNAADAVALKAESGISAKRYGCVVAHAVEAAHGILQIEINAVKFNATLLVAVSEHKQPDIRQAFVSKRTGYAASVKHQIRSGIT